MKFAPNFLDQLIVSCFVAAGVFLIAAIGLFAQVPG